MIGVMIFSLIVAVGIFAAVMTSSDYPIIRNK